MRLPRKKDRTCGWGYCGECGVYGEIRAEVISWDYAGTHCTHGKSGTHYEGTDFLSECCDAQAFTDEAFTVEFDGSDTDWDDDGPDTYDEARGVA